MRSSTYIVESKVQYSLCLGVEVQQIKHKYLESVFKSGTSRAATPPGWESSAVTRCVLHTSTELKPQSELVISLNTKTKRVIGSTLNSSTLRFQLKRRHFPA